MKLTKNFSFEAAHRLVKGYVGKCNNIHGHSWQGGVTLEFSELDDYDMGLDYAKIKEVVKRIEDKYDHGIILFSGDLTLINFCETEKQKLIVVDNNPTSEILSLQITRMVMEWLEEIRMKNKVISIEIEIKETCTTKCVNTLYL